MSKIKLTLKWLVVFTVLNFWTYLVLQSMFVDGKSTYEQLTQEINPQNLNSASENSVQFRQEVYIETGAGIEKASAGDIIDSLFMQDFIIEKRTEIVPDKECSLRAEGGTAKVNGEILDGKNKLSFNVNDVRNGKGSGNVQKGKTKFSFNFKISDVVRTDNSFLILEATGAGRLNREKITLESIQLVYDKAAKSLDIVGEGDILFDVENMSSTSFRGCEFEEKEFFLIINNGELEERRNIEEVREIVSEHPEFLAEHAKLKSLFRDYWWLLLPSGGPIS